MREVIETRQVKTYEGNCIQCGIEQKSDSSVSVDILCRACNKIRYDKVVAEKKLKLKEGFIGFTIVDINLGYNDVWSLIVEKDGKKRLIHPDIDACETCGDYEISGRLSSIVQ